MKNRVAEHLKSDGFEVRQEAPIPPGVKYHRHKFLVDVLAVKDGREIAIEVGQLRHRTIEEVAEHVDEAHHIKYQNSMSVGMEKDLHRVVSSVVTFTEDPSIKQFVSDAVVEHLKRIDDPVVDRMLQKYGYDSIEDLEAVVNGDELPNVATTYIDERMVEILDPD